MYTITAKGIWSGRVDSENVSDLFRLHQVIHIEDLSAFQEVQTTPAIGIIGFKCDEGVRRNKGRVGAYHAPDEIRRALSSIPGHLVSSGKLYDFGNVSCDDGNLEQAQAELGEYVQKMMSFNIFPVIIGGGHEVAYGHFLGLKPYWKQGRQVGIVNFDAHFDMRHYDETTSSGTMFKQMADELANENLAFQYMCIGIQRYGNTKHLFDTAKQYGCEYILEDEMAQLGMERVIKQINAFIQRNDTVMVTLCSDVIGAGYAPGVSAPQPFGMEPKVLRALLKEAVKHKKTVSFDIAEINPKLDLDNRTVKLAAAFIVEVIDSVLSKESDHGDGFPGFFYNDDEYNRSLLSRSFSEAPI
ncbi:formimidoylglutamase [Bacillus salipaludis]|uniref:Formimidoylglutamase n=1 Tax=Bacillus salipaludis TaxID=2547811 RepID=A0A4R5VY19_9BACI|nr:formimidoylglutamase [Bacillus salipaludis]TDK64161.1 formimidoylglutamase [Bacillus salipaludis]